jgi:hypothetical protein
LIDVHMNLRSRSQISATNQISSLTHLGMVWFLAFL